MGFTAIRIEEETRDKIVEIVSILNVSGRTKRATFADAVKIAVEEWLERNRVLYLKQASERNAAQVEPASG